MSSLEKLLLPPPPPRSDQEANPTPSRQSEERIRGGKGGQPLNGQSHEIDWALLTIHDDLVGVGWEWF